MIERNILEKVESMLRNAISTPQNLQSLQAEVNNVLAIIQDYKDTDIGLVDTGPSLEDDMDEEDLEDDSDEEEKEEEEVNN